MLIVIDTNIHSDTNDIICYMIVFWELSSYWGIFKTFLHGWNEKIWIVCHVRIGWKVYDEIMKFGLVVYVCMKWWNLDRLFVWTDLNNLNRLNKFLNRLNRFLNRFYVWISWTKFFMKFLWKLNRFCCCFLSRLNIFLFLNFLWILNRFCCHFLNRFCVNKLNRFCCCFFWWDWIDFWTDFMCEYCRLNKIFFIKRKTNRIFNVSIRLNWADRTTLL